MIFYTMFIQDGFQTNLDLSHCAMISSLLAMIVFNKFDAHSGHFALLVVFLDKTLDSIFSISGGAVNTSPNCQPLGFRLSVRFLNWTIHRCDFGEDSKRLFFHNGAKAYIHLGGPV